MRIKLFILGFKDALLATTCRMATVLGLGGSVEILEIDVAVLIRTGSLFPKIDLPESCCFFIWVGVTGRGILLIFDKKARKGPGDCAGEAVDARSELK